MKQKASTSDLTIRSGKVIPSAVELEVVVLGAMLMERSACLRAVSIITHEDVFFREIHQILFRCMKDMFNDGVPVDLVTVSETLKKRGELELVGGAYYISELSGSVNSGANLDQHMRMLQEYWIRRLIISTSSKNMQRAYDDTIDAFETLDKAGIQLLKMTEQLSMQKSTSGSSIYNEAIQQARTAMLTPGMTGVPSGIKEIDLLSGGWQKSDLIVLAARPGMGKTALAMEVVGHVVLNQQDPVLVFSLEMNAVQLVSRLLAKESKISGAAIKKGHLSDGEFEYLQESTKRVCTDNLIIDDTPGISITQLRAKAITMKMKHPSLKMIVVDYLQLMSSTKDHWNREGEISEISRSLKSLAKELNIPVIALSQLSRSVETRGGDKRPQLSDLRESGAIEQDADVVIFIYRPEYYGISEYEDGATTNGKADIIFAKHRNGPLDTVTVGCNMQYFSFHTLQESPAPALREYNPNKFIEPGSIDEFENGPF